MRTSAQTKRDVAQRRQEIQDLIMHKNAPQALKKKRGRPPKAKVQSIREAELQNIQVQTRMELEPELVEKIVAEINAVYPGIRLNREGSREYIFSHYRCPNDHKRAPGWPCVITSSRDVYYYSPDGQLYEHQDNRKSKEKME